MNGKIVSLDDEVKKWGWNYFQRNYRRAGSVQWIPTCFLKMKYRLRILWNDVEVISKDPLNLCPALNSGDKRGSKASTATPNEEPENASQLPEAAARSTGSSEIRLGAESENLSRLKETTANSTNTNNVLNETKSIMSTTFKNESDIVQIYNFRFEHTYKRTLRVTVEEGVTYGGTVSLTLKVPEAVEGASTLSFSKQLTETREMSMEAETKLIGDCTLTVPEKTIAEASTIVTSSIFSKEFKSTNIFRGLVRVCLVRRRDNCQVMSKAQWIGLIFPNEKKDDEIERDIKGFCQYHCESRHEINVKTTKLQVQSSNPP